MNVMCMMAQEFLLASRLQASLGDGGRRGEA